MTCSKFKSLDGLTFVGCMDLGIHNFASLQPFRVLKTCYNSSTSTIQGRKVSIEKDLCFRREKRNRQHRRTTLFSDTALNGRKYQQGPYSLKVIETPLPFLPSSRLSQRSAPMSALRE